MKSAKLKVKINKPAHEVFEYSTNPKNTPKWIDSIAEEQTSEWPIKLGTTYRNRGENRDWSEYEVTAFEQDKLFKLSEKNGSYHVVYTVTPIDENSCELEYYEIVDEGELENPFTQEVLNKLKALIESE